MGEKNKLRGATSHTLCALVYFCFVVTTIFLGYVQLKPKQQPYNYIAGCNAKRIRIFFFSSIKNDACVHDSLGIFFSVCIVLSRMASETMIFILGQYFNNSCYLPANAI